MSMMRRNPRRFNRNNRRFGSKTEIIRKPIPRISTVNRKIKKLADSIELKRVDSFFNNNVGNDGTDILLMNALATGATANLRIGNQVQATSLQFRGSIETDPQSLESGTIRVIVFWDRQPNGANPITATASAPAAMTLLDTAVVTVPVLSPYNYSAIERYRVLYDKTFTLNSKVVQQSTIAGSVTGTDELVPIRIYFKKKIKLNRAVKYDASAGDITDITTNSLFAVFYSDNAANEPILQFGARFYYKDA